jgi:hypothetical protein
MLAYLEGLRDRPEKSMVWLGGHEDSNHQRAWLDQYVVYDCAGTGTYDYRTRVWFYTAGGAFRPKETNVIYGVTC